LSPSQKTPFSQRVTAEFLGTLALVYFSAGAICAEEALRAAGRAGSGSVGPAIAYGATYAALVAALGSRTAGYFNPAVAIGRWVTRRLNTFQTLLACAAELGGATVGAYLLRWSMPEDVWRIAAGGAPDLASGVTRTPGMLIEGVVTFFVVLVLLGVGGDAASESPLAGRWAAGLAAGLMVTAGALFEGPFTGAAMNPARAFGPAIAARHLQNHGVYWVGPLAGGILAAWILDAIFRQRTGE